ncbi:hypothetical protein AK812_SmicGene16622 [Symbiodinium microadriaticum]|uniref:Uncharacterized protein n=1 Tax=Symbiodinium microadriaticum TaxID=2951 RepID=A0A1Q9DZU2_SYMMI|nr:hypothetical protein AK812_SmicGene16622 [Symbiodinium microadriaticum]
MMTDSISVMVQVALEISLSGTRMRHAALGPSADLWKAYIHAAPGASCAAMTAGAGKKVHTYRAAKVEVDYASFVGGCAKQGPFAPEGTR